jgi:hypothetical protein
MPSGKRRGSACNDDTDSRVVRSDVRQENEGIARRSTRRLTVPAGTLAAINAIWLAAGFALVLWGLRIFRVWVGAVGMLAGAALGAAVAGGLTGQEQAVLIGALAGGVLGGLIAWPLQRITVFLTAGAATAMIAAVGTVAFAGSEYVAGAALVGFLAGGILAYVLYTTVIIAAMAFTGAQAVFHALYVPADTFVGSPAEIGGGLLAIYASEFIVFVATTALFVGFALWYQQGPGRKRERSAVQAARALAARRVSTRLAFVIVAAWVAAAVFVAAGFWPVSAYELVGMHPLSWPVVALAAIVLLGARPTVVQVGEGADMTLPRGPGRRHMLSATAFAAVVAPVLTAAMFVTIGGSWDGLADYHRAFLAGPGPVVAAKWAFSLAVMPLLLFSAHPIVYVPVPPIPVDGPPPDIPGDTDTDEDEDPPADPATADPATADAIEASSAV